MERKGSLSWVTVIVVTPLACLFDRLRLRVMEIISEKPAGENQTTSYTYIHNRLPRHCKRIGAAAKKIRDKACAYWLAGNCRHSGDECKYLHSHVTGGSDVTFLTKLVGHDSKVGLG